MKTTFFLFLVLILTIGIFFNGCKQGQPAKTNLKQSLKAKAVIKNVAHVNDTLIFKDTALSALVQKTEKLFSVFDTINTNHQYDITRLHLDKAQLKNIRLSTGDSVSTDTVNGASITGVLSGVIADNLLKILNWKNIDNYDLKLLLKNHLGVAKSPDGRLYSFSFDEQTGGTYHSRVSIIHYNLGNGPKTFMTSGDGAGSVFNRDGYIEIDTINTKQGIKYLLTGDVMGCTTCQGFYIDLVYYRKGKFIGDFNYNTDTRADWSGDTDAPPIIAYDAKLHRININYITDDLTPACNCGKNGSVESDQGGTDDTVSKESVNCIYAFNGRSFVLKKKEIKPVK